MKFAKIFQSENSNNRRNGSSAPLFLSLLMALMVFATTHVGSAWAEPLSIVSLSDVNGSGSPEVSVLKRETFDGKNHAYVMDAGDGALINSVLFGDGGTVPTQVSQAVVPDFDDGSGGGPNGVDEIAMLGVRPDDGAVVVLINDASTGAWIKTLGFDADFPPVAMAVVPDMNGNGISEIAVLGVRASDGKVRVAIKDASTNSWIPPLTFDANYPPVAMKVVEYASGAVGIAVLGVNPTNGNVKVVVRDVSTRNKIGNAIYFGSNFPPVDMAVVPDIDGNSEPEIAVLGIRASDGNVKVLVMDASTGDRVNAVFFDGSLSPVALEVLPDINGSGYPEIAVLGVNSTNGQVKVVMKDASSSTFIPSLGFGSNYPPVGMTVLPDMNGNGSPEIAVLVDLNPGLGPVAVEVIIKDASSATLIDSFPLVPDGDDCNSATPVILNSTVYGIIDTTTDNDYFRIEIPSSGLLTVHIADNYYIAGYLKDSNCTTTTSSDKYIGSYVDAGTYYVAVRGTAGYGGRIRTGDYTLDIRFSDTITPFTDVAAIVAGYYHSMALKTDGTVWSWGTGYLGDETTTISSVPVQVNGLTGVTAIAGGRYYSVALKTDGTAWAWGYNYFGQLGNGTTIDSNVPVQVSGLTDVTAISAGYWHTLAVKTDGTAWAWGYNYLGQLGNGTTIDSSVPVQVNGLTGVTAIAAGDYHSIAVKTDGTVWAWGHNYYGQLGDGTTATSYVPVQVCAEGETAPCANFLTDVIEVAVGDRHTIVIKNDGTVWAWGYNWYGQLGATTTETCGRYSIPCSTTPLQVCAEGAMAPCSNFLTGVTGIAAGYLYSMALKTDGTVWAWGRNSYGQLGNGTTTDSNVPLQVCASGETAPCSNWLTGVAAIAAGYKYSMAVKTDGTVWAWGDNYYGVLGDGTTADSSTPVQVIDNPWLP